MNDLGKYLRHLRGNRSLRDVAERTGISHTYIRDIENGYRRGTNKPIKPSPETLKKLAETYNASYVELMVMAGYWDEEELLEPMQKPIGKELISEYFKLHEEQGKELNENSSPASPAKELSIPIEELANHTLTYKGHVLSVEEKQHLAKLLQAAAEMLEKK